MAVLVLGCIVLSIVEGRIARGGLWLGLGTFKYLLKIKHTSCTFLHSFQVWRGVHKLGTAVSSPTCCHGKVPRHEGSEK